MMLPAMTGMMTMLGQRPIYPEGWAPLTGLLMTAAARKLGVSKTTTSAILLTAISCSIRAQARMNASATPLRSVRAAALALVSRMYFPYDRMAIITFDANAITQLNLSTSQSNVVNQISAIEVAASPPCPGFPDPRGCTSTNIADGLEASGNQFGLFQREEAVWIVILLTDGGANAATDSGGSWICPGAPNAPTWMAPFCRDPDFEIGTGAYGYDAEDAAEDAALFVGCPDSNSPQPAACPAAGQGAVIFSIGLGDLVVDNRNCDPAAYPPGYPTGCAPEAGEDLLRYIAGVGDDGDPATPSAIDPCFGEPTAQSCGNYYFSPTGSGLLRVFEAIASRIFYANHALKKAR